MAKRRYSARHGGYVDVRRHKRKTVTVKAHCRRKPGRRPRGTGPRSSTGSAMPF